MSYVVPFTDYTPTAAPTAWTGLTIEEAATPGGPWTLIDTQTLVPDADPAHPSSRSFTTNDATLLAGWYRVTFTNAAGDTQPFDPVFNGANITPPQVEVARLVRARTAAGGGQTGVFSDRTDPTSGEVDALMAQAATDLTSKVGVVLPVEVHAIARAVVAVGTAMLIELGSRDFDRDRYDRLERMYDTRLAQLVTAAQEVAAGGEVGAVDDQALAVGSFPIPAVSWDTEQF